MTARRIERICCGVALDGLMSGESWNSSSSSCPRKYATSPTLRSSSTARDLGAHLGLGGLGVHALDDAEAGAEDAREDLVRRAPLARRAAVDARRRAPASRERTRKSRTRRVLPMPVAPTTVTVRVCFLSRAAA